ncbi:hypothetical protein BDF14DRAFT_1750190 [Spinellus fusiger]|nr:hypothetical protein BDF14DRAFT_1750190 [Spinellus fusiger]
MHIDSQLNHLGIPFGTGNDFSQVLGWGRTPSKKNVLGSKLHHLEALVSERLETSDSARLDVWEVEITTHASGYVCLAGPHRHNRKQKGRKGVPPHASQRLVRKMCNYMSIGVQGYVGSGFEKHRGTSRLANILVYTRESAKWVFWRHFPPVTWFIGHITCNEEVTLVCPDPTAKSSSSPRAPLQIPMVSPLFLSFSLFVCLCLLLSRTNAQESRGKEVDLWGEAKEGLASVSPRSGPTDPSHWSPQLANDGKMEIIVIETMWSYIKKLMNIRRHVSRIGQFSDSFAIHFRPPVVHKGRWWDHLCLSRYAKENRICIMCDGEFYIIKDPKQVTFKRCAQIWALGRSDSHSKGRLVMDELASQAMKCG